MKQSVKTIVGNWKMNGEVNAVDQIAALRTGLLAWDERPRLIICPPFTLIDRMAREADGREVEIGAQDCHAEPKGAFTGSVSAEQLVEAGACVVILGHSERRAMSGETDAIVSAKVAAALRAGLEPIVCVGETLDQRQSDQATQVVEDQLAGSLPDALDGQGFCVAYEPVWAIGTGHTPTLDQIEEIHRAIRKVLIARFGDTGRGASILYGGSVNPANASEILALDSVDGALVGGASLKAGDFLAIAEAALGRVAGTDQG